MDRFRWMPAGAEYERKTLGVAGIRRSKSSLGTTVLALLFFCLISVTQAGPIAAIENQKIEYLIGTVEALPNARFIRNGVSYDGKAAASHLRLKLRSAGSRVQTAQDFIRLCASASSMSGLPYQIQFPDGHLVTATAFLQERLVEFETQLKNAL